MVRLLKGFRYVYVMGDGIGLWEWGCSGGIDVGG